MNKRKYNTEYYYNKDIGILDMPLYMQLVDALRDIFDGSENVFHIIEQSDNGGLKVVTNDNGNKVTYHINIKDASIKFITKVTSVLIFENFENMMFMLHHSLFGETSVHSIEIEPCGNSNWFKVV